MYKNKKEAELCLCFGPGGPGGEVWDPPSGGKRLYIWGCAE